MHWVSRASTEGGSLMRMDFLVKSVSRSFHNTETEEKGRNRTTMEIVERLGFVDHEVGSPSPSYE